MALPVSDRRLIVIFNPVAGRRRPGFLERVVAAAHEAGARIDVRTTRGPGDAETMAATAVASGTADVLVAAGGDGTINEVANGMMTAGRAGHALPPLGIVPLGTANVLAHELDLPFRAPALGRLLAAGGIVPVHAGLANGRLFTMMAGSGMDARVVAGIDPAVKRRLGKGAYALGSLREIMAGPGRDYRVQVTAPDGSVTQAEAASCIVCNGHYYGGTFVLAPKARLTESGFYAVLFLRPGRLAAFTYATAMVMGLIPKRRDVMVLPAVSVTITGPEGEPVQGDGDVVARLPVAIHVASAPLAVLGSPPR